MFKKNKLRKALFFNRSEETPDSIFFPRGREGTRGEAGVAGNVSQDDLDLLTDIRNFIAFQVKFQNFLTYIIMFFTLQFTVYSVQCTVYSVNCTV